MGRFGQARDAREVLPVAIDRSIALGVADRKLQVAEYEVWPYSGYSRRVEPWQVVIGSRGDNDERVALQWGGIAPTGVPHEAISCTL